MTHTSRRLVLIWVALCALTVAAFAAGEIHSDGQWALIAVIVAALIKVRFVILDFMEVRSAPLALRVVLEGWLAVLGAILLTIYA
jgi:lipid-A-disaccharide synthase-like uncharacterized protein